MRQLKFGPSSVRGVVGDALTPELIVSFAAAFGTWCEGRPVVIGRDTRGSSAMLRAAVTSGLLATGCEVIDLGLASTPLCSFAVRELGTGGGLAITGSHNDAAWNALKFLGPDGAPLGPVRSEELLDLYHASQQRLAPWDWLRPVTTDVDLAARYQEHLRSALDVDAIRARGGAVVVDLCNGPGLGPARALLEALGCTLHAINAAPTGRFAHPPAPSPAHMGALAAEVRRTGAALGAAINVDGDRVAFVTAEGAALSEEYTLPLAAAARLRRRPGPVVTSLSTSGMVEAVARAAGQPLLRTAVGESHVIDLGMAEGAALAGEGSGGVAALPTTMTFDALLTLGLVLEEMAVRRASLRDLVDGLPRLCLRKRELPCPPGLVHRAVDCFRAHHAGRAPDCTDGVRVTWPDGWLHVRASLTEPLLRIIVEAEAEERAEALLAEALALAAEALPVPEDSA